VTMSRRAGLKSATVILVFRTRERGFSTETPRFSRLVRLEALAVGRLTVPTPAVWLLNTKVSRQVRYPNA